MGYQKLVLGSEVSNVLDGTDTRLSVGISDKLPFGCRAQTRRATILTDLQKVALPAKTLPLALRAWRCCSPSAPRINCSVLIHEHRSF